MKISPMDIQRQAFGRKLRGLDPDEVRTYLNIVAEEVAALQIERDRLDQEVQDLTRLSRSTASARPSSRTRCSRPSGSPRRSRRTRASRRRPSSRRRRCRPTGCRARPEPRPRGGARDPRPARAPHRAAHRRPGPHHPAHPDPRPAGGGRGRGQPALPEAARRGACSALLLDLREARAESPARARAAARPARGRRRAAGALVRSRAARGGAANGAARLGRVLGVPPSPSTSARGAGRDKVCTSRASAATCGALPSADLVVRNIGRLAPSRAGPAPARPWRLGIVERAAVAAGGRII